MNALDQETLADNYLRNESCTLRNVWRYQRGEKTKGQTMIYKTLNITKKVSIYLFWGNWKLWHDHFLWMNEWMNVRTNEWTNERTNEWNVDNYKYITLINTENDKKSVNYGILIRIISLESDLCQIEYERTWSRNFSWQLFKKRVVHTKKCLTIPTNTCVHSII
jgi:hypothetical protein